MLSGTSVGLRAIGSHDLPQLLAWRNDPRLRRYFREHRELNLTQQRQWFESKVNNDPTTRMFAIVERGREGHVGRLLGACGLCYIDWVNRTADFSIYIGADDLYIDERFAPDAAVTMIGYAFDELGLHRLWSEIYGFDAPKQRFFEALGFNLDGVHRQTHWAEGAWHDSHYYSLLATDPRPKATAVATAPTTAGDRTGHRNARAPEHLNAEHPDTRKRQTMKNLAVIPARGGSKRIPRKNIKLFGGKPMITYAIAAARESELFDEVIVSTDDDEIAEVAQAHGATIPFRRPPELADDQTTTVPVIAHAAQWYVERGRAPEAVCCIYPCVPLLRAEDLSGAHAMFAERGAEYVYPVVQFHSSPWRGMRRPENGPMQFVHPEYELTRTQDLERMYFDAGQFYWGRTSAWCAGLRMHSNGHGYVVEGHRVVDIDTPEDWKRAELIARAL